MALPHGGHRALGLGPATGTLLPDLARFCVFRGVCVQGKGSPALEFGVGTRIKTLSTLGLTLSVSSFSNRVAQLIPETLRIRVVGFFFRVCCHGGSQSRATM